MNEYRQRALNRVNNTNVSSVNTTSTYRQRALNRQQPKSEEPKIEEIKIEPQLKTQTSFKPVNTREFIANKFLPVEEIEKKVYTLPDGSIANKNDYTAEEQQKLLSGEYVINPNYNPKEYMSQKILYKGQIKDAKQVEQERWDNANALGKAEIVAGKVGNTLKDIGTSAILGPIQAAEGWTDTGLTVAANAANLIGAKDTADYLTNMIKLDAVGDAKKELDSSTQSGYGRYNPNVLGVDLRDIAREGTRMFTAGTGGLPGFITSAIGGNVQESLNEGQSLGRASIYGGLTGTAEGAFEKLFDTFNLLGGGVLDKFIPKNAVAKLAITPAGEYIEEWLTQGINPFIKMATYEGDIKNPFASWENVKEWFHNNNEAGWQGFVMGLILKGTTDISNSQARQEYKNEVKKAVNKIKGLTEQQKQETINELVKGAENSKIQIEEVMQNYKQNSQYDKYIPQVQEQNIKLPTSQENVARGLPTMASQQAMLPTSRIEAQTAQTGNIEQMAKNIENNNILEYNNNRGVENGREQEIIEGRNQGNLEETKNERGYTPNGERNLGQTMGSGAETRLEIARQAKIDKIPAETNIEKQIEQKAKELGIDVHFFKNGNIESGFAFENGIYLDKLGKDRPEVVFSHELFHNARQNNNPVYTSEIKPIIDEFADSAEFVDVFNKFNDTLQEEIPVNQLAEAKQEIIEEIFADYTAKVLAKYDIDYNMNSNMYKRLENAILKITQPFDIADTQSAFSMPENYISPVQDIQKASDFINKATVEDIDTLNKMVEEAEKYPDRLDLQFFAEKAREAIEKLSRQQVRQAIMEETDVESYNLDDVNKISKAKMNFTTPVRVIEKIFNKETANKINENFFKPIKHNEAERIRRLNKERADIKELGIKPGSAEDAAIQKYGEGEYVDENGLTIPYTLENLKIDFPETWQKLQNATNVIRNKYDTYLEEINEVLQDNGYDPIPKRKDYFRHFEELNDLFSVLGVPTKVDDIPTDLNGMTADLKPGKQFFANALQRKGNKTTYSAIKGIDGYLDGAMNILYHTKDIQKLRTLDKYIRDTYGQAKGLADANTMTDEQKAKRINQINEGHLSEFAAWLTEYTNALAGKKSRLDRGMEEMFGRRIYKTLNLLKKQVGANMTGLNINTALSNFISLTQATPKTNKKALVKGTVDTLKNIFNNDGFIDKSDFLTTRFGSDKLAKNWWQKAGDVGQIFMSGTDYFTANLIVRSKYQEFLDKGYSETESIKKADEFADRLMAGRGKGDLPNAFESKMLGIVTQFQLEVSNQIDSMFYDTFQENYAAESKSKLAKQHPEFYNAMAGTFILGQIFALAFLFNEGKEELTGAEGGAFDPIGTIADAFKYYTNGDLKVGEATAKVIEDIANQLPFASIVTGGGRIPIKESLPNLLSILSGETKLGDEMWKLTNLLLPTGGGQVKKTTQGLSTFAKGGSYTKDAEGKDKLKYPVEQTPSNAIKSALFGKWATPGAKDYIDRGFKPLSANQTEAYEKAMKAGISSEDFFKAYDATRGIEGDKDKSGKTIENSKSKKLKEAIDKATTKLTSKQRKILYDAFNVSKTVQGGSGLPTQSELRANLPKVQIKIEK